MHTHDHICRVIVVYRSADGRIRWTDSNDPRGDESWSAEYWLNLVCATAFVRANWLEIQVTRESPGIRKKYLSPLYKTELLINPPKRE